MPDYSYTTMSLQTIDTRKLKAPHMNSARSGIVEAWKLCYHLMHGACGLSKFAQRTATIIGGAPGVSSCVVGICISQPEVRCPIYGDNSEPDREFVATADGNHLKQTLPCDTV